MNVLLDEYLSALSNIDAPVLRLKRAVLQAIPVFLSTLLPSLRSLGPIHL